LLAKHNEFFNFALMNAQKTADDPLFQGYYHGIKKKEKNFIAGR
jgi:hypothetical protein